MARHRVICHSLFISRTAIGITLACYLCTPLAFAQSTGNNQTAGDNIVRTIDRLPISAFDFEGIQAIIVSECGDNCEGVVTQDFLEHIFRRSNPLGINDEIALARLIQRYDVNWVAFPEEDGVNPSLTLSSLLDAYGDESATFDDRLLFDQAFESAEDLPVELINRSDLDFVQNARAVELINAFTEIAPSESIHA